MTHGVTHGVKGGVNTDIDRVPRYYSHIDSAMVISILIVVGPIDIARFGVPSQNKRIELFLPSRPSRPSSFPVAAIKGVKGGVNTPNSPVSCTHYVLQP